jgi:hypothetical protein
MIGEILMIIESLIYRNPTVAQITAKSISGIEQENALALSKSLGLLGPHIGG